MTAFDFAQRAKLRFRDLTLLIQALTHPSYCNETPDECDDSERMEFLGDAIVDFIVAEMLYKRFGTRDEGDLTRLRAALVSTESLGGIAARLGVGDALRMGRGEEAGGGRSRLSNLCNALEAIVGAIYLDSGMDAVRAFVVPLMERRLDDVQTESLDRDPRSLLQEWMQAVTGEIPRYEVVGQSGPDHAREWRVQVYIGSRVAGEGVGRSKQAASHAAARAALEWLAGGKSLPSSKPSKPSKP
jgi:ribonuclease-3